MSAARTGIVRRVGQPPEAAHPTTIGRRCGAVGCAAFGG